jgi:hypothetical protein
MFYKVLPLASFLKTLNPLWIKCYVEVWVKRKDHPLLSQMCSVFTQRHPPYSNIGNLYFNQILFWSYKIEELFINMQFSIINFYLSGGGCLCVNTLWNSLTNQLLANLINCISARWDLISVVGLQRLWWALR